MTRAYLEGSHGSSEDYHAYLEERFQGEVYGEAFFRTMAERCEDPARARKLRVLEQLERETKEFLRPLVQEAGFSGEEHAGRIAEGETLGGQLAGAAWHEVLQGFRVELERFVSEFETAEALAPPEKRDLLRHVTAHEKALLDFSNREIQGDHQGSLESVIHLLRNPPAE